MPDARGRLQTGVTIVLRDAAAALDSVREEFDAEAVASGVPLHITLLFPFIPRDELDDAEIGRLERFFAARERFALDLVGIGEFPGVVYARPEPDDELRALMRALWREYPSTPPYEGAFDDPTPHATLARVADGEAQAALVRRVEERLGGVLPLRCEVVDVSLLEEHAVDRWREAAVFPLRSPTLSADILRPCPSTSR